MANRPETLDSLLGPQAEEKLISTKKMFGEVAIYHDATLVALLCEDTLFLKPTDAAKELLANIEHAPPYPGAKPYFVIPSEIWADAPLLAQLMRVTAAALPKPTKKSFTRAKRKSSPAPRVSA